MSTEKWGPSRDMVTGPWKKPSQFLDANARVSLQRESTHEDGGGGTITSPPFPAFPFLADARPLWPPWAASPPGPAPA